MSIVRHKSAQEQFRCRISAGVLVYEQSIPAAGGPNNYQKIDRQVVSNAWSVFYRERMNNGGGVNESH